MSHEWHDAIPVDYLNRERKIGRVYVGVADGPPMRVREQDFGLDSGQANIVLEFEHLIGQAGTELIRELDLPELHYEHILRLCLHLSGARKLCMHLVTALAGSGDEVASLLQEKMLEAMDEIRKQREQTHDTNNPD